MKRTPLPVWHTPRQACRLVLTGKTALISGPVAAVVGTLLSLVNQGHVLLEGKVSIPVALRIAANYAIPFCVSSYSALSVVRVRPASSATGTTPPGAT